MTWTRWLPRQPMMQITVELQSDEDARRFLTLARNITQMAYLRCWRPQVPCVSEDFFDPETASVIFLKLCASGVNAHIEPMSYDEQQ
jgi:hypothetical protein